MRGTGVMYEVKGDSRRGKRVTEGAAVQLRRTFCSRCIWRELLKWWKSPGRTWEGEPQAGVGVGGVIAAMIAVTTVRRDNKSNYKDGHPSTDPAAV